jgi:hypothetical protein
MLSWRLPYILPSDRKDRGHAGLCADTYPYPMECPTAKTLYESYGHAAMEHVEAIDKLPALIGQHDQFAEAILLMLELSR